ncbi:MAG: hypothetical protein KA020_17210 [Planctomycetes bacterium]|jgi:hypothetical protein|nr:hypothetical protein [Planctomycetota bacterium]MCC7063203.1 hypothetical protein [Planctomycetota bacterium]
MVEQLPRFELSPLAQRRQHELLPQMLGAVRRRRHHRRLRRSALALGLAGAVLLAFWPWQRPVPQPPREQVMATAAPPRWVEIATDPGVVARCEVVPIVRAEWFVDDGALQELLTEAGRPPGLVCIGSKVQVVAAAIDLWGSEAP